MRSVESGCAERRRRRLRVVRTLESAAVLIQHLGPCRDAPVVAVVDEKIDSTPTTLVVSSSSYEGSCYQALSALTAREAP